MKTIVIDGKKYKLLPCEEEEESPPRTEEKKEESLLEAYSIEPKKVQQRKVGVEKAIGKVSDYRERFKRRALSPAEFVARPRLRPQLPQDRSLDKFEYKGEKLFFGDGVVQEY